MGRRRAAFREGIAEAERQYAQALRDIRDLRGETQQELGRLLGWSVSMVSRFEAAAERPDQATHRRYCALAPTEELRRRAAAAYDALPSDGSARHPAVVRRSPSHVTLAGRRSSSATWTNGTGSSGRSERVGMRIWTRGTSSPTTCKPSPETSRAACNSTASSAPTSIR